MPAVWGEDSVVAGILGPASGILKGQEVGMRAGFAVGNIGPIGTAENLMTIAQRAEALGYHTLWSVERLLWPLKPQTPYALTPDGSLPAEYKHVLDPLEALTFVAAYTQRIGLGTSVLVVPTWIGLSSTKTSNAPPTTRPTYAS